MPGDSQSKRLAAGESLEQANPLQKVIGPFGDVIGVGAGEYREFKAPHTELHYSEAFGAHRRNVFSGQLLAVPMDHRLRNIVSKRRKPLGMGFVASRNCLPEALLSGFRGCQGEAL